MCLTDTQDIIDAATDDNVRLFRAKAGKYITSSGTAQELQWGEASAVIDLLDALPQPVELEASDQSARGLTLLASDVLYNRSSDFVFLETLQTFFALKSTNRYPAGIRAVLAYRSRSEGDDRFFRLAVEGGLQLERKEELGFADMQVWVITG